MYPEKLKNGQVGTYKGQVTELTKNLVVNSSKLTPQRPK